MSLEMTGKGHELWRQGYNEGFKDGSRYSRPLATRVRLYLDFDGVINAPGSDVVWPGSEVKTGVEYGEPLASPGDYKQFDHTWSQALIDELKTLDVELMWATTWTRTASESLGKKLGFGDGAPYITPLDGVLRYPTIAWKKDAIWEDQRTSPSPFIWCDDELTWTHDRSAAEDFPGSALVVQSNYYTGITPDQIADMRKFIQSMKEPN